MAMLLLNRDDIAGLMSPGDYLAAVEDAFRALRDGRAVSPPPMQIPAANGSFHAKGASLRGGSRTYAAVKFNGNFPGNRQRAGLPTIQGAILLCDAGNGAMLAILDSIEITLRRTAAASALAARLLARPQSATLAVCGCGDQARAHVAALTEIFRFRSILAWDGDPAQALRFAAETGGTVDAAVETVPQLRDAARAADIIVTCTTAQAPFLGEADVSPGAFIAAVGADNPEKSEIAPSLMARSVVVVDVLAQCRVMGDLHHALAAGVMTEADVHAELADVLAGARPGRSGDADIVIFDSTGSAIQDVASAALACERALAQGRGTQFALATDPS